MGDYYAPSITTIEDKSVALSEAEVVTAAGAQTAMPQSLIVSPGATVGDVTIQEYGPGVQRSISDLMEVVESSVLAGSKIAEASAEHALKSQAILAEATEATQEVLGEKLIETQQPPEVSILPDLIKWLALTLVGALLVKKVIA